MAGLVGALIGLILAGGTAFTALLSTAVVFSGSGGLAGITPTLAAGFPSGLGAGAGAYAIPIAVGGGIVYAAALTMPGLVYLRGASCVYLRAVEGLDLFAAHEALREKVTAAQARAKEFQVQAQAAAQQYAQRAQAPAPASALSGVATVSGPASMAIAAVPAAATCPVCSVAIVAGDLFCANCGHKLN